MIVWAVATNPAHAQQHPDSIEVAVLTGWPESLPRLLDDMGPRAPRLLPAIDSLALEYAYDRTGAASSVSWTFQLSWRPGRRVLYEGRVLPRREAPPQIRMASVELLADVIVDGQRRAEMIIAVDSLRLAPQPQHDRFNVSVGYDRVFLDTPPAVARRYLKRGITLANLRVERMGFVADGMATGRVLNDRDPQERRPAPAPRPRVYEPRVRILVGWRIGPDPYYVGRGNDAQAPPRADRTRDDAGRTPAPDDPLSRGDDRSETEQSADESSSDPRDRRTSADADREEDGDDEDGDDDDLLVPALAAAGAVGAAAFIGGTIGVFGTGDTPIGLAAGYTQPNGGIHLQAAINDAVLDDDGTQRLTVKAMGFYDLFAAPVQPAVGLGVQAVAVGDDTTLDPSVSVGLVGRFGPVLLYGGVDGVQGTPEASLTFNVRH